MIMLMLMTMMMMNEAKSRKTVSWAEDEFFESIIDSSGSEDDDFEDSRMSFASTRPSDNRISSASLSEYNLWMAQPLSITERRMRLLEGMGLSSDKELIRVSSMEISQSEPSKPIEATVAVTAAPLPKDEPSSSSSSSLSPAITRSRSDEEPEVFVNARRDQLLGPPPHPPLVRTRSSPSLLCGSRPISFSGTSGHVGSLFPDEEAVICKIKDLDTGKEFVVKEFREDGMWNQLSDTQTGKELSMEEFEKWVGYSPIVKELMRRVNVDGLFNLKVAPQALSKSFKSVKKKRGWLKNIKGVASTSGTKGEPEKEKEKDRDVDNSTEKSGKQSSSSKRMKVHQHGKAFKELTGLYMCQEIQAHQGSIWTIRFSLDARYLASAGEDRVIHIWEVVEIPGTEEGLMSPVHPTTNRSSEQPSLSIPTPSERKKKGKLPSSNRKSSNIADIVMPDTIFSLSETPVCSFQGHLDDVLDLSWSKSQQLLSSSMDKTVRLWDIESKSCLKLFAHNDYVTCIQFNPVDDNYFISGSLDAKVRIWSIPDRQVVDWSDQHEMVTAACFTPDGEGALIGSHKGSFRVYSTSDCKLVQRGQMDIQTRKKKTNAKKITGFQFAPGNPSEVLITSADSQIRLFDGIDLVQKFRGFRNTSSQMSASFTSDGRYVVCASEDSQVYVWRCDDFSNMSSNRKNKPSVTTRSHEHFQCRDVSVAVSWPGFCKFEPPSFQKQPKKQNPHPPKSPNSPKPTSSNPPNIEEASVDNDNNNNNDSEDNNNSEDYNNNADDNKDNESNNNNNDNDNNDDNNDNDDNNNNKKKKKAHLPPLPKKSSSDEPTTQHSRSESAFSSISFDSSSTSTTKSGLLSSFTSSMSGSWMWYDGNGPRTSGLQTTAWGLVIVTAGLDGEIKAYQNFGLPVRINRQASLF